MSTSAAPFLSHPEVTTSRRMPFVAGCAAFMAVYFFFYKDVVAPIYYDFGFPFVWASPPVLLLFAVIGILPSFFIPLRLTRPSQFLYIYIYITLYLPACVLTPILAEHKLMPLSRSSLLAVVLMTCFIGMGRIYSLPLRSLTLTRMRPNGYIMALLTILAVSYAVLLVNYWPTLKLSSVASPHEQRLAVRSVLENKFPLIGYFLVWPSRAFNPMLVALGWWYRKKSLIGLAILGEVFIYSCAAQRECLFWIFVVLPLVLFSFRSSWGVPTCCAWGLAGALLGVVVLCQMDDKSTFSSIPLMIFMRVLCYPPMLTIEYYSFFSDNPYTYFSHVTGLHWIAENPYTTQIGLMIGAHLSGNVDNNANVNFWGDGCASLGLVGMMLTSILTAATFYAADCATNRVNVLPGTIALSRISIAITNCPIFTTFLGGGMGMAIILSALAPWSAAPIVVRSRPKKLPGRASTPEVTPVSLGR